MIRKDRTVSSDVKGSLSIVNPSTIILWTYTYIVKHCYHRLQQWQSCQSFNYIIMNLNRVKETTNYMSEKRTTNFCSLKKADTTKFCSPKKRSLQSFVV